MKSLLVFAIAAAFVTAPALAQPGAGQGVTLAEMQQRMHARFARMDTNGDGRLSAAEREQAMQARQARIAQRRAGRMDRIADANGDVTMAAMDARIAERFARLDANRDGRITRDERPRRARGMGAGAPGAL